MSVIGAAKAAYEFKINALRDVELYECKQTANTVNEPT